MLYKNKFSKEFLQQQLSKSGFGFKSNAYQLLSSPSGGPRHWEHLCNRNVYSDHLLRVDVLSLSEWNKHRYLPYLLDILG
ncbi:MAG: hypothetical protein CH6_0849 [Candidatus Kapaibacterium sp.]|nr:MAG: hypothetical protein CH6_0849 [Candidatus Kapabacteria bacterium]